MQINKTIRWANGRQKYRPATGLSVASPQPPIHLKQSLLINYLHALKRRLYGLSTAIPFALPHQSVSFKSQSLLNNKFKLILLVIVLFGLNTNLIIAQNAELKTLVLKADNYKHYVDYFNKMEDENIKGLIPNAQAWDWMKANIPLFDCPQQNFEEMFYFRWWTLRKHIIKTPVGLALTEFLINRSYADKYNLIACAFGHHLNEGRWLHDQQLLDDYTKVWFRGDSGKPMKKFHGFSSWAATAVYNRYLVNNDKAYVLGMLPDLDADYKVWETEKKQPNGLFWQTDVKDGMEETISGGRREKNQRTTINSYMYGNAVAISKIAELANNKSLENKYQLKADTLKDLIQTKLWNDKQQFFETLKQTDTLANVKEEVGFIPWYFNLPDANRSAAWANITDTKTFNAPYGITTADRSHPQFRTHGCCKCEWDGAVWPFATSQTLTAMANLMNNYQQDVVADSNYFNFLQTYVESQYHRGRPYVGEYLDEKNGFWLMGDAERSRYYNHSTFNDLIITGLIGLRPRADNVIEVNPLIPQNKWDWFCLDNVLYHNKLITIIWDKDGTKYKRGRGLSVWMNGKKIASADNLQKLVIK